MNKNIIIVLIGTIAIFALVYTNLDDSTNEQNVQQTTAENTTEVTEKQKKNVEILYLDDSNKQKENIKEIMKTQVNETVSKETSIDTKVQNYIVTKQLQAITLNKNAEKAESSKHTIYSNISLEEAEAATKSDMQPPMAPTIVSGKFDSGETYSVIIPTSVKSQANEIIITNNNADGTPKESITLKQDDPESSFQPLKQEELEQTITIETPPSIGQ